MTRHMTLSDAVWGSQSLVRQIVMVLLGTLFIALAAKVSVPMFPVPMTMQMLAILLVGFAFGAKLAAVTLIAYLAQGYAGLPVFSPNTALGPAAFFGPTAGFLIGFVGVAWGAGWAAERGLAKGVIGTALTGLVLSALLYVPGILWPMGLAALLGVEAGWVGQDFASYYWIYFMQNFLLGDAVKAVIAAMVVTGAWKMLKARN